MSEVRIDREVIDGFMDQFNSLQELQQISCFLNCADPYVHSVTHPSLQEALTHFRAASLWEQANVLKRMADVINVTTHCIAVDKAKEAQAVEDFNGMAQEPS